MKTHKTFTLTRALLDKWNACDDGIADIAKLLPAKISTDPEDNIKLAVKLAEQSSGRWLDWLLDRCRCGDCGFAPDYGAYHYNTTNGSYVGDRDQVNDAMLIAQQLAWAADSVFNLKGK